MTLSATERRSLLLLATVGFLGINTLFVYGLIAQPGAMRAALTNPIALAFMVEATLLIALAGWILHRLALTRITSFGFIALSLLGGLAFSIPIALLLPRKATKQVATNLTNTNKKGTN